MEPRILSLLTQALFFASCFAYTARSQGSVKHSRTPEVVTPEQFDMFQMYANFSSASYSTCGATPEGSTLVDYINIQKTTTQGVLFRNDALKEFVLAFPGTVSAEDSRLDFEDNKIPFVTPGVKHKDCEFCHVHRGFLTAWNSISDAAAKSIKSAMADFPHYQFSITGHSLGAAIASLATASLKGQGFKVRRTVTFGEPRVGGPRYANHIDQICGANEEDAGTYHRVTHANDGVPQAPTLAQGYRHSRTEYWESVQDVENYQTTFRCFGQEPSNCNDMTDPTSLTDAAHGFYAGIVMGALADNCAA